MAPARRRPMDELMIVNPGSPGALDALAAPSRRPGARQGSREHTAGRQEDRDPAGLSGRRPPGRFFLGSDGTLYEVID